MRECARSDEGQGEERVKTGWNAGGGVGREASMRCDGGRRQGRGKGGLGAKKEEGLTQPGPPSRRRKLQREEG